MKIMNKIDNDSDDFCSIGANLDKKLSILEQGFVDYRELANGKLDLIRSQITTVDIKATQCNNEMCALNKNLAYRDEKIRSTLLKFIFSACGLIATTVISVLTLILTKVLNL